MLSPAMQNAVNEQINNELYSSYSYLSMSAYLESQQFRGCASWMKMQSGEEYAHAMRLYKFRFDRPGVREGARPGTDRHAAD
jgi:ferritin